MLSFLELYGCLLIYLIWSLFIFLCSSLVFLYLESFEQLFLKFLSFFFFLPRLTLIYKVI